MMRFFSLLAFLLPGCGNDRAPAEPGAAAKPAKTVATVLQQEGRLLIDVRTPGEFASGHVAGSVNIPMDQLGAIEKALGRKDAPAVLFCRSGARSGRTVQALEARGYTGLINGGGAGKVARLLGGKLVR